MCKAKPKVGVEYAENAVILTLTDERILEEGDITSLEQAIMPVVAQEDAKNIVLDFSNVKFLTSAALGLLIRISKRTNEAGGELKLCSIDPKILEIFKITRLDRIFGIYGNRQQALQSFN